MVAGTAELGTLFAKAHEAGLAAGAAAAPAPMVVSEHDNPLDDASPAVQSWVEPAGLCGFAWVTLRPGTSRAAKFAKKKLGARAAYGGGTQLWVHEFGQSVTRKGAYARAFATVLSEAGFTAYAGSRLD